MDTLSSLALGFLLNSLWQVPLLFACGSLTTRLLRRLGPLTAHRVWVVALVLATLLPACSLLPLPSLRSLVPGLFGSHGPSDGTVTVVFGSGSIALPLLSQSHVWLLLAYALFLLVALLRFAWRLDSLRVLRREASTLSLEPSLASVWSRALERSGDRGVVLVSSRRIASPAAFGVRRPVIALPANVLDRLSSADLEAILAHELAHVARHDFFKNLLLELLVLPVSYHPLLWALRSHMTQSREVVCDALATELIGRRRYAHSLLRLASLLLPESSPPAISHAIGLFDANSFDRRLMHLTRTPLAQQGLRRALPLAAAALFALTTCTAALALRVDTHITADHAAGNRPVGKPPIRVSSDVMAGSVVSRVNPTYPQAAREAKIQGAVVLRARIGKDGSIKNLQIVSGPKELRAATLDAVHQWTYKPYVLNGDPLEVDTTITVNYSL